MCFHHSFLEGVDKFARSTGRYVPNFAILKMACAMKAVGSGHADPPVWTGEMRRTATMLRAQEEGTLTGFGKLGGLTSYSPVRVNEGAFYWGRSLRSARRDAEM